MLLITTLPALLVGAFPANSQGATPQTLTYDVVVHDRPIGQFNVTKASTTTEMDKYPRLSWWPLCLSPAERNPIVQLNTHRS